MNLPNAVRHLREHAKEPQRSFAATLGMSFSALQKYESRRPPAPDSRLLVAFLAAAINHSRPDLAAIFQRELMAVLSPPPGFAVEIIVKRTKGKP
jgi:transcriptional regulator with XRE-family HTH domain